MAEQNIRPRNFTDTATDSDLQNADNYVWLDTVNKAKKLEITKHAPRSGSTSEIRNLPDKSKGYLALNDSNGTGKFDIKTIFDNLANYEYISFAGFSI